MKTLIHLLAILLFISSCASVNYTPHIELYGETSDSTLIEEKADDMTWDEAKRIKSFIGKFPKGIEINVNGELQVSDKYEIIGKVSTTYKSIPFMPFWLKGFYDYPEDENWRNIYCGIQTPLHWITIEIWTVVPIDYPCQFHETNSSSDIKDRRMRVINTLKKMTYAAGGQILVMTNMGKIDKEIKHSTLNIDMLGAEGYAIKIKKAEKPKKKRKKTRKKKKRKKKRKTPKTD